MIKGLIENECAGQNPLIKLTAHFNNAQVSEQQQKLVQVSELRVGLLLSLSHFVLTNAGVTLLKTSCLLARHKSSSHNNSNIIIS
jgi:hypothetical protein